MSYETMRGEMDHSSAEHSGGNKLTYACPECGEKWTTHIIQDKPYTCPKCLRKILKGSR